MTNSLAIVVVTYNRPDSLKRLLSSLAKAHYDGESVTLIISIDYSGDDTIEQIANVFKWRFGEKIINTYSVNQGLRNHIIQCGSYTEQYEGIVVLEDDLYVSPYFYAYAKEAVAYYKNNDNIAGISLYGFETNQNNTLRFSPYKGKYDTYFMNIAQSWGQIWTYKSWSEFYNWYDSNKSKQILNPEVPKRITTWPESSWLKYHYYYCIVKKKYFVYPYQSLSTNFGDPGIHMGYENNNSQVHIKNEHFHPYNFAPFDDDSIRYDAFYEPRHLSKFINIPEDQICIDIYGDKGKPISKRYWLTTQIKNYKIIKQYSCMMRPWEANIVNNIPGSDIFIYDTAISQNNNSPKREHFSFIIYNIGKYTKSTTIFYFKSIVILLGRMLKAKLLKLLNVKNMLT